jgi:hypothetical protein
MAEILRDLIRIDSGGAFGLICYPGAGEISRIWQRLLRLETVPGFGAGVPLSEQASNRLQEYHSEQERPGIRTHMSSDKPLVSARFPRSAKYNSEWSISGSANARWLSEWLAAALNLRPKTHEGWEEPDNMSEPSVLEKLKAGVRNFQIEVHGENAEHYERAASTPQTPTLCSSPARIQE